MNKHNELLHRIKMAEASCNGLIYGLVLAAGSMLGLLIVFSI